jgi:hypothetical protein
MSRDQRSATPVIDYLRPIVADGDTGHGGLTAVMKLMKVHTSMRRCISNIFDMHPQPSFANLRSCSRRALIYHTALGDFSFS